MTAATRLRVYGRFTVLSFVAAVARFFVSKGAQSVIDLSVIAVAVAILVDILLNARRDRMEPRS